MNSEFIENMKGMNDTNNLRSSSTTRCAMGVHCANGIWGAIAVGLLANPAMSQLTSRPP